MEKSPARATYGNIMSHPYLNQTGDLKRTEVMDELFTGPAVVAIV